ncbi:CHD5-like protein-domain-containing protein [Phascolomyces articulosus]|uniref:CHD5-like protein-domain-containing protein n=1 Tax=Phascolomyces articulosus TaxID=60185 RepID=A0AAD5PFD1_9FUNG|nr:CHD5-like protein-domain-containing protein [Phascolomyces articulosus]
MYLATTILLLVLITETILILGYSYVTQTDEFAKWAKMRRKLDKGMADLEKLNSDIAFTKAAFELRAKSVLWFFVHGTRTIIAFWYTRRAAFYLPKGWFGPAEWFLWMPLAPRGMYLDRNLVKEEKMCCVNIEFYIHHDVFMCI